eukprot:sb/3469572/
MIIFPFHHTSLRTGRVSIALIWMLSFSYIVGVMYNQHGAVFKPNTAICSPEIYDDHEARGPLMVALFFLGFIPLVGVFGINLVLLGIAIRKGYSANSGINYKALFVILSLSGLFMLSWVPWLMLLSLGLEVMKSIISPTPFEVQTLVLLSINAISLNTFGNPFLYTLTNRRFGRYVRSLLCGMFKAGSRNRQIAHRTGNREVNLPARNQVRANNTAMQSNTTTTSV